MASAMPVVLKPRVGAACLQGRAQNSLMSVHLVRYCQKHLDEEKKHPQKQ